MNSIFSRLSILEKESPTLQPRRRTLQNKVDRALVLKGFLVLLEQTFDLKGGGGSGSGAEQRLFVRNSTNSLGLFPVSLVLPPCARVSGALRFYSQEYLS